MSPLRPAVALLSLALTSAAFAQSGAAMHPPQNVVSFQSSASTEVAQDQMRITLSTTLEGSAAQEVQGRLKKAVDAALAEAKQQAQAEKMEVTTGSFRINPRYGKDSKITGWQGYAEVMLEGTDFARITSTAAQIKSLNMSGISFGLAPKTQREAEAKAQGDAINSFKNRAQQLSTAFGFRAYSIREVNINGNDYGGMQPVAASRMKVMMASPMMEADSGIPAEPGKTRVEVSVNGSIQMQ
jgi:predicted secreted protein